MSPGHRKSLSSASMTFPDPKGPFEQLILMEGKDLEFREEQSRNNSTALGEDPGSPSRDTFSNTLRPFIELKRW